MRNGLAVRVCAVAIAVAMQVTPALATTWVQYSDDPWFWLDTDSITQRDGLTYYRSRHSAEAGVAPGADVPDELTGAINCATGDAYWYHYVDPSSGDEKKWENTGSKKTADDPLFRAVCGGGT